MVDHTRFDLSTFGDKVSENYCRRWAKRLGLILRKSYARRWSIDNQRGYNLITFNGIHFAGQRFELTLEQVADLLAGREQEVTHRA